MLIMAFGCMGYMRGSGEIFTELRKFPTYLKQIKEESNQDDNYFANSCDVNGTNTFHLLSTDCQTNYYKFEMSKKD